LQPQLKRHSIPDPARVVCIGFCHEAGSIFGSRVEVGTGSQVLNRFDAPLQFAFLIQGNVLRANP
jgi:Ni,Fe-hydrogenase III small subunit